MKLTDMDERHVLLAVVLIVSMVIVACTTVCSYYESQQTLAFIKAGYTKQMVIGYDAPVWVKP